jgi:hypothetical protein
LVVVDGWNIDVKPFTATDVQLTLNKESQVSHWPVTDIPMARPQ